MDLSLHGHAPTHILTPTSVDDLAAALRSASADGIAVVPWGTGSRQHIGLAPERYDLALRTAALASIVEYNPADLVITVQGGAPLGAVQAALAAHGQWLPWDPPAPPEATVGGLLASAASGPLRLGYGAPRDWTLGMQVVLGDGRPVRSGGKVVKNVAGYDSHKLHLGALGTLGVIVEVTFKVAPLPTSSRTLLLPTPRLEDALAAAAELRAAPLGPISLVVAHGTVAALNVPFVVLARYAGAVAAVARQFDLAAGRCAELWPAAPAESLAGDQEAALWQGIAGFAAAGNPGLLVRAGGRPSELAATAAALSRPAERRGWPCTLLLYPGVGLAYGRWAAADTTAVADALAQARRSLAVAGGYVVVEDSPAALRPNLDLWGPAPPTLPLMQSLKAQWDANRVLSPGRYVGGI